MSKISSLDLFIVVIIFVCDNNDWTLRLTIRDNTELGSYCHRIVAIVNPNVIIGSAWYGQWGSLLSLRQYATITTGQYSWKYAIIHSWASTVVLLLLSPIVMSSLGQRGMGTGVLYCCCDSTRQ